MRPAIRFPLKVAALGGSWSWTLQILSWRINNGGLLGVVSTMYAGCVFSCTPTEKKTKKHTDSVPRFEPVSTRWETSVQSTRSLLSFNQTHLVFSLPNVRLSLFFFFKSTHVNNVWGEKRDSSMSQSHSVSNETLTSLIIESYGSFVLVNYYITAFRDNYRGR